MDRRTRIHCARMATVAHTIHIGSLTSGVAVGQVAVCAMLIRTVFGSDASFLVIQPGLMMLTWTANPVSYEQAFDAIKAGVDSLPPGVKMFLNSGVHQKLGTGRGD